MYRKLSLILLVIATGLCFQYVCADESIPITFSGTRDHVQFDGKWTFEYEWKETSLNTYYYDNNNKMIILRSAHQGNFVYIFIDAVSDESLDKEDKAIICFDAENDKNKISNSDDYCFLSILGNRTGVAYQGNPNNKENNYFSIIPNPAGYIGASAASDEHDRYSAVPHTGYEFRIPTDTIGRKNIYGFYFAVYDEYSNQYYSYPTDIDHNTLISSPNEWGEIYSPDKTLPEFYLPLLIVTITLGFSAFFTKTGFRKHLQYRL